MNEFSRCHTQCLLGVKAYQNVRAALMSFERLCTLAGSDDHILVSSFFHTGVIRYAKPFTSTISKSKKILYGYKKLKSQAGFSEDLHKHILNVRDTLIAHDDLDQIEPRVLSHGISMAPSNLNIPVTLAIANKCISHPADLLGAQKLKSHIAATLSGIEKNLFDDLGILRSIIISHPDQASEARKYKRHVGQVDIPADGARLAQPDINNEPWLNPNEPDYSTIHNGFVYETLRFKRDFHGPETIQLPDGTSINISL